MSSALENMKVNEYFFKNQPVPLHKMLKRLMPTVNGSRRLPYWRAYMSYLHKIPSLDCGPIIEKQKKEGFSYDWWLQKPYDFHEWLKKYREQMATDKGKARAAKRWAGHKKKSETEA